MNRKKNKKKKFSALKTMLLIIAICIALYWVFFALLGIFTNHGKEIIVPNVEGKLFSEVQNSLEKEGYSLEVDSSYNPNMQALEVMDQLPKGGKSVKKGRTLFLTINKITAPEIIMPDLVNLSYRSAEMVLKNNKLILGDTIIKPDLANGAVIEMLYQGKRIPPNARIKQGEIVDLVIGGGLAEMAFDVPDVLGFKYDELIHLLSGYSLHASISFKDDSGNEVKDIDTFSAIVVAQSPKPLNENGEANKIRENQAIHIIMKAEPQEQNSFWNRRKRENKMEEEEPEYKYQYENN